LATCAAVADLEPDDRLLLAPLAERGIDAVPVVWDDPAVDWDAFDLVVLRSTWDYAERREAFLDWARSVPRVLNPLPVLEWSTDKQRYLTELSAMGVPVVPTRFVAPGIALDPPAEPFVVKPAVSAGGRSSARFEPDETDAAEALLTHIHAEGRTAMVQPYLGDADETALVYIDGVYSHAVRRSVPLPGADARAVLYLDEAIAPAEAAPAARQTAEAALGCAPDELLYARVDLLGGAVLELELAEPSLYFSYGEGSADRFAAAVAAASQRRRMSAENGPTTSQ
jgi:glutathione synthase/RimK-type ligase-like ATP-grasp enzyme